MIDQKNYFLSLDFKTDRESPMRTVCGSEFQTAVLKTRKSTLSLFDVWCSGAHFIWVILS